MRKFLSCIKYFPCTIKQGPTKYITIFNREISSNRIISFFSGTRKWLEKQNGPNPKKRKRASKKNKKKHLNVLPNPGENTVLLDRHQMKNANLPIGAVEIGTIAETDPLDENEDPSDEGRRKIS